MSFTQCMAVYYFKFRLYYGKYHNIFYQLNLFADDVVTHGHYNE